MFKSRVNFPSTHTVDAAPFSIVLYAASVRAQPIAALWASTNVGGKKEKAKKKNASFEIKHRKIFLNQFLHCKRGHQTEKDISCSRAFTFISTHSRVSDELTIAF